MNSSIPRWYLISKAEAMEQSFSLAPIYLIVIKMWCYYLWMRCSTTFNSLLFLRPCIFCPTLSFPGEIWGGRGSSGAFLASLVCLSLSLSLPLLFSYRLSLTQCYQYFLHESASLSLQERWSNIWFFLVKYAVIFSEIKSRRELFYFTHNLFSLFTGFAQIPWFFSISSRSRQLLWFLKLFYRVMVCFLLFLHHIQLWE